MTVRIPLTTDPNQTFNVVLPINNINVRLTITLRYLGEAGYWTMDIAKDGTSLLAGIPLVTGVNLLGQYQYLGIGSAAVAARSSANTEDPSDTNLASDYILLWGDNVG